MQLGLLIAVALLVVGVVAWPLVTAAVGRRGATDGDGNSDGDGGTAGNGGGDGSALTLMAAAAMGLLWTVLGATAEAATPGGWRAS